MSNQSNIYPVQEHLSCVNSDYQNLIAQNNLKIAKCDSWSEAEHLSKVNFHLLQMGLMNLQFIHHQEQGSAEAKKRMKFFTPLYLKVLSFVEGIKGVKLG